MGTPAYTGILPIGRTRPPRSLNVVPDPEPEEVDVRVDWSSWYLTDEEDMGQSDEQALIIDVLRSCMREVARERGWEGVYINGDQFFAWIPEKPLVRVSPDIFLIDDPPEPPRPSSWQTWKSGHRPPRFAVEIVSGEDRQIRIWRKDYDDAPAKYAQLGTRELVIFDPEAAAGRSQRPERVALQLYRREVDGFVRVHSGDAPIYSQELQIWLFVRREGEVARLRLARDADLRDLVPTAAERAEAEHRRAEEAVKHAKAADMRAEAAEQELAALKARLDRLDSKE